MPTLKQREHKCPDGLCPPGVDSLREISLTPQEKIRIFSAIKAQIFDLKKKRFVLLNQS